MGRSIGPSKRLRYRFDNNSGQILVGLRITALFRLTLIVVAILPAETGDVAYGVALTATMPALSTTSTLRRARHADPKISWQAGY
jgi:K+ transporter